MSSDPDTDRESWRDMVRRLRSDDAIDEDQETVLIRYFSDKEVVLQQTMQRVSDEYAHRSAQEGVDAADAWLRDTAQQMGRQDREDAQRMLSSLGLPEQPNF